jgi:hypothetical protein
MYLYVDDVVYVLSSGYLKIVFVVIMLVRTSVVRDSILSFVLMLVVNSLLGCLWLVTVLV